MIGQHGGLWAKGNALYLGTNIHRPNMFEYSVLVPLIIRWPEVVEKGGICNEMVSSLNFFPTFIEILRLAGVEISEDLELNGVSMMPLLEGKTVKLHKEIYLLYDMQHGAKAHMRMLRTEEQKLILHYEDESKHEFYNLKGDPGEEKNVYNRGDIIEIQDKFTLEIKKWQKEIGDMIGG